MNVPSIELPLLPLERVSPSRFGALKKCRLREVWIASKIQTPLPSAPAAKLGTVIHSVLEHVARGRVDSIEGLEGIWETTIALVEKKMMESESEKHLVPLASSVYYFEVKKRMCMKIASELLQPVREYREGSACPPSAGKTERWLESNDKVIGGAIDRIETSTDGDILIDYKSGAILQDDEAGEESRIKEDYQLQMKLYAGLYHETFGRLPVLAKLVALDGTIYEVAFTEQECMDLMEQAKKLLAEINGIINSNADITSKLNKLASPSPENCKYCLFRPGCIPYLRIRSESALHVEWPLDFSGNICEMIRLGNGRLLVKVLKDTGEKLVIRGLHPGRHKTLANKVAKIMFFSVRPEATPGCYIEGLQTMVFPVTV